MKSEDRYKFHSRGIQRGSWSKKFYNKNEDSRDPQQEKGVLIISLEKRNLK
jgi:hypothetical protein